MGKYSTKYFGKITIDETSRFVSCFFKYDGQNLHIVFSKGTTYGDKLKICLEILDKYNEINEIAKNAIFKKLNQNKFIELNYPNLEFYIKNEKINISLEYNETSLHKEFWERFNKAYKEARTKGILIDPAVPPPLNVKMDDELNVLEVECIRGYEKISWIDKE